MRRAPVRPVGLCSTVAVQMVIDTSEQIFHIIVKNGRAFIGRHIHITAACLQIAAAMRQNGLQTQFVLWFIHIFLRFGSRSMLLNGPQTSVSVLLPRYLVRETQSADSMR